MDDLEINNDNDALNFGAQNDDLFDIPPPLPGSFLEDDPADLAVEQNEDLANPQDNVTADATQESGEKKKKKRAFKPRVNLNEERLCSKNGIQALKNLCSDANFKGKGHEVSDLNKLLHRFEHWAQCLMPRWPFDNVVQKCELLGSKSKCRNELKRVRRNEEDILRGEPEDEGTVEHGSETLANNENEAEVSSQQDDAEEERSGTELTEEQLERIRRNQEIAFQRREEKKRRRLAEESQTESPLDEPTSTDPIPNGVPIPNDDLEIIVRDPTEQPSSTDITSENSETIKETNNEIFQNKQDEEQNRDNENSLDNFLDNEANVESPYNTMLESEGNNSLKPLNVINEEDKNDGLSDNDDDILSRSAFELKTTSHDPLSNANNEVGSSSTDEDVEELQSQSCANNQAGVQDKTAISLDHKSRPEGLNDAFNCSMTKGNAVNPIGSKPSQSGEEQMEVDTTIE